MSPCFHHTTKAPVQHANILILSFYLVIVNVDYQNIHILTTFKLYKIIVLLDVNIFFEAGFCGKVMNS